MNVRAHTNSTALVVSAMLLGLTSAASAQLSPRDVELTWKLNWKNYARRVVKINDQYFTCATYQPLYPSSRGVTIQQLRTSTAKEVTERVGTNVKIRRHMSRPYEDLKAAAETLPEVAIGHYGVIHSGEILAILKPDEFVIGDSWFVDGDEIKEQQQKDAEKLAVAGLNRRDMETIFDWHYASRLELLGKQRDRSVRQPIKLIGFSSIGLAKGDRWRGPDGKGIELAVVGSYVPESRRRGDDVLIAIPTERFKQPVDDEAEFLEFLKTKEFSKQQFAELFDKENKANPRDDALRDARIFAAIEGRSLDKSGDDRDSIRR